MALRLDLFVTVLSLVLASTAHAGDGGDVCVPTPGAPFPVCAPPSGRDGRVRALLPLARARLESGDPNAAVAMLAPSLGDRILPDTRVLAAVVVVSSLDARGARAQAVAVASDALQRWSQLATLRWIRSLPAGEVPRWRRQRAEDAAAQLRLFLADAFSARRFAAVSAPPPLSPEADDAEKSGYLAWPFRDWLGSREAVVAEVAAVYEAVDRSEHSSGRVAVAAWARVAILWQQHGDLELSVAHQLFPIATIYRAAGLVCSVERRCEKRGRSALDHCAALSRERKVESAAARFCRARDEHLEYEPIHLPLWRPTTSAPASPMRLSHPG